MRPWRPVLGIVTPLSAADDSDVVRRLAVRDLPRERPFVHVERRDASVRRLRERALNRQTPPPSPPPRPQPPPARRAASLIAEPSCDRRCRRRSGRSRTT